MTTLRGSGAAWIAASMIAGCGGGGVEAGRPTPAGYWEGKVSTTEIPMKDPNKSLTRKVDADFWFTVKWDAARKVGTLSGEADAKYDAELKVDNLPKVTAPVPGGGNIKFEPSVGGKLTETDNRRKFPIVGVITLDDAGNGTLVLQKANAGSQGTRAQQLDNEAKGNRGPDAPMEFTMRADPGVSGGIGGAAGSLNYNASTGRISGGVGGVEQGVDTGKGAGAVIIKKIPMTPFTPFREAGGKVEKRPGGPYAAAYEEKTDKLSIAWSAKQMGGEQREAPRISPEVQAQIDALLKSARR